MESKEFDKILRMIKASFPNRFMTGTKEEVEDQRAVWNYHLKGSDYDKTMKRVHEYVGGNEWPPTIADIKPFEYQFDSVMDKVNAVMKKDEVDGD